MRVSFETAGRGRWSRNTGAISTGLGRKAAWVAVWPLSPPKPGHMGILPSAVGPEPIVRLQVAGLKVGESLSRARRVGASMSDSLAALERSGYGSFMTADTSTVANPDPDSKRG